MLAASTVEQLHVDPVEDNDHIPGFGLPDEPRHDGDLNPLVNEVRSRLNCAGRLGIRKITIAHEAGRIVLGGSVRTWFEKQLAQHLAMQTPGVARVVNELVVRPDRSHEH